MCKTIFEKYWGNLVFEISIRKIDLLPRVTMTSIAHALIFNTGFLGLSLNLTFWGKAIREATKRELCVRNDA